MEIIKTILIAGILALCVMNMAHFRSIETRLDIIIDTIKEPNP